MADFVFKYVNSWVTKSIPDESKILGYYKKNKFVYNNFLFKKSLTKILGFFLIFIYVLGKISDNK